MFFYCCNIGGVLRSLRRFPNWAIYAYPGLDERLQVSGDSIRMANDQFHLKNLLNFRDILPGQSDPVTVVILETCLNDVYILYCHLLHDLSSAVHFAPFRPISDA